MSKKKIKVLWAFDPFSPTEKTRKNEVDFIKQIHQQEMDLVIDPVYVLGAEQIHWVGNVSASHLDKMEPFVFEEMKKQLEPLKISGLSHPKVIKSLDSSRRDDVSLLCSYMEDHQYDLSLLSTHSREGLTRWFMGSFTENFLMNSQTPMAIVNPHCPEISKIEKAFCPIDFTEASLQAFQQFLETPFFNIKEVVLYTKIQRPFNAFVQSGVQFLGGGWVAPEQYLDIENENRKKEGEKLCQWAQEKGYKTQLIIDDGPKDLVDAIEEAIKDCECDISVLGTSSSRISQIILGSTTKNIIRTSQKPVLVYHYND